MVPTMRLNQVPIRPQTAWRPIRPSITRLGQEDLSVDLENFDPEQLDPKKVEDMMSVVSTLFRVAEGAVLAWVGFATASREEGLLSTLGYTVGGIGILRGAGAILGVILKLAGVEVLPEKEEPEVPQPTPTPAPPVARAL